MTHAPSPDRTHLLTPERCARLRETFDRALEEPAHVRGNWLMDHVPDPDDRAALALLLAAEDAVGPLDVPSDERIRQLSADDPTGPEILIGRRIGAFRLVRLLGQGGMATVFLGERQGVDFRQHAAVKLLRRGLYSPLEQRLFRREQQALASLTHPNIAHFIDGGISEAGVPYLILEYVDGVPLVQHATEHDLSIAERLRVFVVICRAVAVAHRQLIVHRDLNPSNILVDRHGEVKLLDFGIAKLLAEDQTTGTGTGVVPLTPEYAAPEQFSGGTITTATDVYALGVILHELLLGERPPSPDNDDRPPSRRLAERSADSTASSPTIAALRAAIKGDLDNIMLKALAIEPERRYGSAGELGDDIERHLAAQPVSAHPPSRRYRASKFVRRHRGGVATAVLLALAVLSGAAVALWQAGIARQEAARARAEAARANTTRDFVEGLFEPVREQLAEGAMPSLRDLVDKGTRQLQENSELGPEQRVDLLLMFSRLQNLLAESRLSLQLAEQAYALAMQALPKDAPLTIEAVFSLGRARLRAGDLAAAEPLLHEVENWQRAHEVIGPDAIKLHSIMARFEYESGRPDRALRHAESELGARIAWHGENSAEAASGYNNLGYALEGSEKFDEAIAAYEKSLAIDARLRNPRSLERAYPLGNLAQALFNAGRLGEARLRFDEVLALHQDIDLKKPTRILLGQLGLSIENELAAGDLVAAEFRLKKYRQWVDALPKTETDWIVVARQTARILLEQGNLEGARSSLEDQTEIIEHFPEHARRRSRGWRDLLLAEIAWVQGRREEAKALALSGNEDVGAVFYPPYLVRHAVALTALVCQHQFGNGCRPDIHAFARTELDEMPYRVHPALLFAHVALARVDIDRGDPTSAIKRLQEIVAAAEARDVLAASVRINQARAWLAVAFARNGDCIAGDAILAEVSGHEGGAWNHPFVKEARDEYAKSGCRLTS